MPVSPINSDFTTNSFIDSKGKSSLRILDIRGSTKVSNTEQEMISAICKGITTHSVPFVDSRITRSAGVSSAPGITTHSSAPAEKLLRTLPTMLLYDDKGLDIFDKITYDKDYYLTNAEIDILKTNARDMVEHYVQEGSVLVELGAGAMRKTKYILEAIAESKKNVTYCAVDLAQDSLTQSLTPLAQAFPTIQFIGLWGTYHDSLEWTQKNVHPSTRKMYIWLGSSIGNLTRQQASEFMHTFQVNGMNQGDLFLCGIDRRNPFDIVSLAYNDRSGLSREFSLNGLDNANTILKDKVFDRNNFEFVSIYNEVEGRHEAYFESKLKQVVKHSTFQVQLEQGELISFEFSYKYSQDEITRMLHFAQLSNLGKWTDSNNLYDLHLFFKAPIVSSQGSSNSTHPTVNEWQNLWNASDFIFNKVIKKDRYLMKPIELRHPYIFYLGHLSVFADIQISKVLQEAYTEPSYFAEIFERGIDPNMQDPTICHSHSLVPDQWPSHEEIMTFREKFRARLMSLVSSGKPISKKLSRALNMSFEHEAMHLETLLYMVLQDCPNEELKRWLPRPIFKERANLRVNPAQWIKMSGGKMQMGRDDQERLDNVEQLAAVPFGWDNECPSFQTNVDQFEIQSRPVTICEYLLFLESHGWREELIPLSWIKRDNHWMVKSIYGYIFINKVSLWPVSTSQFQATSYANHYGLKLPTEAQLLFSRSSTPESLNENHSFTQYCPADVDMEASHYTDSVGNGWEWTSTLFEPFDGFQPSDMYPGYSADFFDGEHHVCLGASWATFSRIATRHSFRNWYQSKYPFIFSKFRCVKS